MFRGLALVYSAIFRLGGILIAALSMLAFVFIGLDIARDGYILVNGQPDSSLAALVKALGTPLVGVAFGIALFLLVPRVKLNE